MARMTSEQVNDFLMNGDHKGTMILAVGRESRGPLCVPLSFRWDGETIRFSTTRSRRHTAAFLAAGRATALIHHELYGSGVQIEKYVALEGSVSIPAGSDGDPDVFVEAVLQPDSTVGVHYDFSAG